jgi:hypothetical protein
MELCHTCRRNFSYIICEYCGNLSIDPGKPSLCIFCSNPKSTYYYREWIRIHPEEQPKSIETDDAKREAELCGPINNFTCARCKNTRCNVSEKLCWNCGYVFLEDNFDF